MDVVLRPVEERDLAELERLDLDPALSEPFQWRGFRDWRGRRRRWELDGYLGDDDALARGRAGRRNVRGHRRVELGAHQRPAGMRADRDPAAPRPSRLWRRYRRTALAGRLPVCPHDRAPDRSHDRDRQPRRAAMRSRRPASSRKVCSEAVGGSKANGATATSTRGCAPIHARRERPHVVERGRAAVVARAWGGERQGAVRCGDRRMRGARPVARLPRVADVRPRAAGRADVAQRRGPGDRGDPALCRCRCLARHRQPLVVDDSARRALRGARVLDRREGGLPVVVDGDHDRTAGLPTDAEPVGSGAFRRRIERRIGGGSCGGRRGCCARLGRHRLVALPGRIVRPRHPQPDERSHPERRARRPAAERRVARLRARPRGSGPHDDVRGARGLDRSCGPTLG